METFIFEIQPTPLVSVTTNIDETLKAAYGNVDICRLCLNLSELESIKNMKFTKRQNNFIFLEQELKFTLPEKVCANCSQKLKEILSFVKQCKDSYFIYKQMQANCILEESRPKVKENCVSETDIIIKVKENESSPSEPIIENGSRETIIENETKSTDSTTPMICENKKTEITKYNKSNKKVKIIPKHKSKICHKCGEEIKTTYTEHYKLNKNCRPKNYPCTKCKKTFKSGHDLGIHQRSQHDDACFMCHICSKTMRNPLSFRRHVREHSLGKIHICEICAKGFSRLANLNQHKTSHGIIEKLYNCKVCNKKYKTQCSLWWHSKNHHPKATGSTENCEDYKPEDLFCNLCKKSFTLPRTLKIHMQIHSGDRTYVCGTCHQSFSNAVLHRQHIINEHGKERQYQCEKCPKRFVRREYLYTHSFTHKDPSHLCPYCGRRFRLKAHLRRHLSLLHNVNKGEPFRCEFCSKAFNVRGNLTAHERIHTGEKPYVCLICNTNFTTSSARKKHVVKVHPEDQVE